MYKIIRREAFSETTFLWEVTAPDVARSAEPGHFVMLRLREGGERIPLTVADYDRDQGTITLVIQALGKTTLEMRDHYKAGDNIVDFVGPLGLPQHVSQAGHVVLVGGGLGVAPVYPQLRAFKEAGNRTTGTWQTAQQPLWPEVVAKGFVVQAKRWVVERTHAWNERARRLIAHHDRSEWAPLAWVWLTEARILATRLATGFI